MRNFRVNAQPDDEKKQVTCCRRDNIESFGSRKKERSVLEWLEYQADYCASGLAMPNATFTPFTETVEAVGVAISAGFVGDVGVGCGVAGVMPVPP